MPIYRGPVSTVSLQCSAQCVLFWEGTVRRFKLTTLCVPQLTPSKQCCSHRCVRCRTRYIQYAGGLQATADPVSHDGLNLLPYFEYF
jgi:hypothetical protein